MKQKIIEYIRDKHGFNKQHELDNIVFHNDGLLKKLEDRKSLNKFDRELLIDALIIIKDIY